ncbi:MAG: sulfite oxidase [Saprospiraceae bacterium]|nr:sulfite oxidase [Saprospiraceae bacterium]
MRKNRVGLRALYESDPIEADRRLWGRKSQANRRGFLKDMGKLSIGAALGAPMVFADFFPEGMVPAGLLHSLEFFVLPGKDPALIVLNDRPVNAETPPHLLDPEVTPAPLFFVRNNGVPPELDAINPDNWTLTIEGEAVSRPVTYTLPELKSKFEVVTHHLTLECAGNGRKEFNPPASGNQWSVGAVGCGSWTGVRLADLLRASGLRNNAVYIGYYGMDKHLNGGDQVPISRGVPIRKALEPESLIAWDLNGEPLPWLNGYPLRLVFGGWPASCSGKWLSRVVVRDKIHDGPKMEAPSYRMPCKPVAPGEKVADEEMCIIESMPVKSLITYPRTGATLRKSQSLEVRGHAWAGDLDVREVYTSIDFGMTWQSCALTKPVNPLAWQHFVTKISFPQEGYYEVWARAVDREGRSQPVILPGWNPKGYLNNACHRIAVKVTA